MLAAAAVAGGSLSAARSASPQAPRRAAPAAAPASALPAAPRPALRVPRPAALPHSSPNSRWAPVLRPVWALRAPGLGSALVAALGTRTPEGTANIVLALDSRTDRKGTVWTRVRLPMLPNNTVGWVPRRALGGYTVVQTHLVVDRERLTAALFLRGRPIFRAPVGVGRPESPTPAGEFYVRDRLTTFASPFYGPVAFGTSARSSVLTDWPAGGFIGIHGTSEPQLLPGRVSHGCVRMRNADILKLARLMPVGTPLTIV